MTISEMEERVREIFPTAQFEHDNDGQLIIYTNVMVDTEPE